MKFAFRTFCILFILSTPLLAADDSISRSGGYGLTLTSAKEAVFHASIKYDFPWLRSDNDLFKDNNISFELTGELSPLSVNTEETIALTPAAFTEISVGVKTGTGWNAGNYRGLAKNRRAAPGSHDNRYSGKQCDGIVYNAHAGAELKFDLEAIFPGEWNHIVFSSYHEIYYKALTTADRSESWVWENDDGENRNGRHYFTTTYIGYQPPKVFKDIGFYLETDKSFYDSKPDGTHPDHSWGNNLTEFSFGPVIKSEIFENLELTVAAQWHTTPRYTSETEKYGYYIDRELQRNHPRKIEFEKAIIRIESVF